ncbi:hypothetical protein HZA43_00205 [Candidatus Peregrinibacteria bacterium]|nr:hypothetical protein [Candidatus Peregrinibacteria bacterium]
MRFRFYIVGLLITLFFGWTSWFLVLFRLSPFITGFLALVLFYASFFLALSSTFCLLIHFLRAWFNHEPTAPPYLNIALRQGTLLSMIVTLGLLFQRLRVLTWWDALLLVVIVVLIEFYMMVRE